MPWRVEPGYRLLCYNQDLKRNWRKCHLRRQTPCLLANFLCNSWSIERASLHPKLHLPFDLKRMLSIADKYDANCAAIKPSDSPKRRLSAWHRIGAIRPLRRVTNNEKNTCLRENHLRAILGGLVNVTKRGRDAPARHSARSNCPCKYCKLDRDHERTNPHQCYLAAKILIENLHPKWRTDVTLPADNLSLTSHC